MNRIEKLFTEKKRNILNVYFTAGFPGLADTSKIIAILDSAGVDMIEVGMPFSDPLADGPTIQQSGQVALKNGMHIELLFQQIETVRKDTQIPIILMGYFNQVMQYGEENFIKKCSEVGVDGLILPDLPLYEYETSYKSLFEKYEVGISFLMTPQTSNERIQKIDQLSRDFVYMVSSAAITGAKKDVSSEQLAYFKRIEEMKLKNPRLIGFGISDKTSFDAACRYANGAIIGSEFIRVLSKDGDMETNIRAFVAGVLS